MRILKYGTELCYQRLTPACDSGKIRVGGTSLPLPQHLHMWDTGAGTPPSCNSTRLLLESHFLTRKGRAPEDRVRIRDKGGW